MTRLPPFRMPNPTNAQGGVTLMPGVPPAGGGSSSGGMMSLSGNDAITAEERRMKKLRGPNAVNAFMAFSEMPALPMPMPGGGGGGGGGRGYGGGGMTMQPQRPRIDARATPEKGPITQGPERQRPRIDARATPAMTTADWMTQNEAMGGDGLTPSYGGMGALDGLYEDNPHLKPKPMAKGGMMPAGKPVLTGEEGAELIIPRDDGSHFVLPADITRKVMPMQAPEMRADGGVMETTTGRPGALPPFAMMQSQYGTGVANRFQGQPLEVGMPMMADEQGMINLQQVPGAPVMPYMADPLKGTPWGTTSGIMPNLDPAQLGQQIAGAQQRLMPQRMVPAGQGTSVMLDGMPMVTADALTLMRERGAGAVAGMETTRAAGDFATREARMKADTERKAAAGAELMAPFAGVPGMTPALAMRATQNMERFIRTPQGSMWAVQQGMRAGADSVTGADMLPVGDAGFVPIVRDAQGNARRAGSFIPTSRTQTAPPVEALRQLSNIMLDAAQPIDAREKARREYVAATGINMPLPKPGSGKGKRGVISFIPGPMVTDPVLNKQVPGPKVPVLVDPETGRYRPLEAATDEIPAGPGSAAAGAETAAPAGPAWQSWLQERVAK